MSRRVEVVDFRAEGLEIVVVEVVDAPVASAALTRAERAVAALAAAGHSDREISALRGTSVRTVGNQLASVYRKLGVASRYELAGRSPEITADEAVETGPDPVARP